MKLGLMSSEFRRELIEQINAFLRERDEILAAYLFGSAAEGGPAVNDIDILVLMNESDTDANLLLLYDLDLDLAGRLRVLRDRIDLIPFDSRLVQPEVLFDALKTGILLKCSDEEKLTDAIENLSRYCLENEGALRRQRVLQREMVG
ncbi:MAG: nucleotidyltransferase domain-containing protein [Desulforhabdus sp.]|jgi:predicted nucleotidyltransferase|nr:nucleotidyltransferase domain-containing protein [Desulforhabdus sp.]